jgi:hypothetical protein
MSWLARLRYHVCAAALPCFECRFDVQERGGVAPGGEWWVP